MKASLKFREEEKKKPLLRAKVPLNILGLPFQSGVVAGESKELTLNLSTRFPSGPSLKLSYRPNDPANPFSLLIKTGTGSLGSPVSGSPLLMSAEFNLPSTTTRGHAPRFMLHLKPQFGDFSIKKTQSSSPSPSPPPPPPAAAAAAVGSFKEGKGAVSEDEDIEVVDGAHLNGKKITILPSPEQLVAADLFSGIEVAARTRLPFSSRAVLGFRWGVRVPSGGGGGGGEINWGGVRVPFLAMNKIGIEHVVVGEGVKRKEKKMIAGDGSGNATDVAEVCFGVKRQLEVLQSENGMLRKAVDDLRQEINSNGGGVGAGLGHHREIEQMGMRNVGGGGGKIEKRGGNEKKSMQSDTKGNVGTTTAVGV